jgi:hypothetical protein
MTLAALKTMAGSRLLRMAADALRGESERIRQTQQALVACGELTEWAEGAAVRRALFCFAAGALEWCAAAGAEEPATAKAQRRKADPAYQQMANAGRSAILLEMQSSEVTSTTAEAQTEGEVAA